MIDPENVLNTMQKYVAQDETILNCLGLTPESTDLEKAKAILKLSKVSELANQNSRLFIYFRPARSTRNQLISDELLQFEFHVPEGKSYLAQRGVKQLIKIIHEKKVGGLRWYYAGQLGDLPTANYYYAKGVRFNSYIPI